MKHTSWLSGFAAVRKPEAARVVADLVLGHLADREQHAGQLVLAEHGQHVGLVLGGVGAASQSQSCSVVAPRVSGHPRVVAGRQTVEAQPVGAPEQPVELDGAVALDARIRRPALLVLTHVAARRRCGRTPRSG